MEKAGLDALGEIWKEEGGAERIGGAAIMGGLASFVGERNAKMAEMQRRVLHVVTQLMKKGIVLGCVGEVVGVVEERQKREEEEEERGEKREIGRELKESVDGLNDEIALFLLTARRNHVRGEKREEEDGEKKRMREENERMKREIDGLKREKEEAERRENEEKRQKEEEMKKRVEAERREVEQRRMREEAENKLKAEMERNRMNIRPTQTLDIMGVKYKTSDGVKTEGNRIIHNGATSWETCVIGEKMKSVCIML